MNFLRNQTMAEEGQFPNVTKLKPHLLHIQMSGDITVHYEYTLESHKAHTFKIPLPFDQLTYAINSLSVWVEGRGGNRKPRVEFPSPSKDARFPLKSFSFEPLRANVGSFVEIKEKERKISGILRNVTYERRFNIVNVILEDPDKLGTFSVYSLESEYEIELKITPVNKNDDLGVQVMRPEAVILVHAIDKELEECGKLCATFQINSPVNGKGFDVSYHLTVPKQFEPYTDERRAGHLECYALLENPLPENLRNVQCTFQVAPNDIVNFTDLSHNYSKDRSSRIDFPKGSEFQNDTMQDLADNNEGKKEGNDETSSAANGNINRVVDSYDDNSSKSYFGFRANIEMDDVVLHSQEPISISKSQSQKVFLYEHEINVQLFHCFDVNPSQQRPLSTAEIRMYMSRHQKEVFIPGNINIIYPEFSTRNMRGLVDHSGIIRLEWKFPVCSSVRASQRLSSIGEYECEVSESIQPVSISNGILTRYHPQKQTFTVFLRNEGDDDILVAIPFLKTCHDLVFRSMEAMRYPSFDAIAADNEVGSSAQIIGNMLDIKEMKIENSDHVVFTEMKPKEDCVVVINIYKFIEKVRHMNDLSIHDIEELALWDNIRNDFTDRLRELYNLEVWTVELGRLQTQSMERFNNVKDVSGQALIDMDTDMLGNSTLSAHDIREIHTETTRKAHNVISDVLFEYHGLVQEVWRKTTMTEKLRLDLFNVPYKSIMDPSVGDRKIRRIRTMQDDEEGEEDGELDQESGNDDSSEAEFQSTRHNIRVALARQNIKNI